MFSNFAPRRRKTGRGRNRLPRSPSLGRGSGRSEAEVDGGVMQPPTAPRPLRLRDRVGEERCNAIVCLLETPHRASAEQRRRPPPLCSYECRSSRRLAEASHALGRSVVLEMIACHRLLRLRSLRLWCAMTATGARLCSFRRRDVIGSTALDGGMRPVSVA